MKFLLRSKSWQILALVCVPFFLPFDGIIGIICRLIGLFIYHTWIFTIGTTMHFLLPQHLKANIKYFKISYGFNLFFCLIAIAASYNNSTTVDFEYIYISISVFYIFSMLYFFSFAGRMLESMIEGRVVSNSDALKALFCFWFFPWGVWQIQPAVKNVLDKYQTA